MPMGELLHGRGGEVQYAFDVMPMNASAPGVASCSCGLLRLWGMPVIGRRQGTTARLHGLHTFVMSALPPKHLAC